MQKIGIGLLLAIGILGANTALSATETHNLIAGQYGELPPPSQVEKVLSAGRVADVFLLSLAPQKVVGISLEKVPERIKKYLPSVENITPIGRLAGRASTAPLEKIVALQPSVIVDVGSVSPTYLSGAERIQQQTNVPYVVIDGRFDQSAQQLRQLGELLGETARAEQLADYAQKVLARTHNLVGKQKIYFGRGADGLETGLAGSIHTEVIDWIGAQNVADVAGQKIISRVSMEQVLNWNPEMIITHDKNFYQALQQGDPAWQAVAAVKNQAYYLVPSEPFGWLDQPPSLNRLLGSIWLSHTLAPQKLPQAEARGLVREYFQQFYHYALSDAELAKFGL